MNVTVQLLNYPKQKRPFFFYFKFSLSGEWWRPRFTLNFAVHFRPKMALTLGILSDKMHMLPRNSAGHTLFLFFCTLYLLCEATCSLRTDKQLGNNVTLMNIQKLSQRGNQVIGTCTSCAFSFEDHAHFTSQI